METTSTDFKFYTHVHNFRLIFVTSMETETVENHIQAAKCN